MQIPRLAAALMTACSGFQDRRYSTLTSEQLTADNTPDHVGAPWAVTIEKNAT
jgi:hypothetical protein